MKLIDTKEQSVPTYLFFVTVNVYRVTVASLPELLSVPSLWIGLMSAVVRKSCEGEDKSRENARYLSDIVKNV